MNQALKDFIRIATASLVIALGFSQAQAQPPTATPKAAPRAVLPFTSFDFGDVPRGELISHIFVIRNEGNANLDIKEFTSG